MPMMRTCLACGREVPDGDAQPLSTKQVLCPDCDDASVTRQSTRGRGAGRYRCPACGETFDEPAEREPEGDRNHAKGLAQELLDTDASEVAR